MAANLYARSIFGEDALANVSIEKPIHLGPDAPVNGHIRIRAKSQVGSGTLHVYLYMNGLRSLLCVILHVPFSVLLKNPQKPNLYWKMEKNEKTSAHR